MKKKKNVIYALRANPQVTQALKVVEQKLHWRPCCVLAERDNLEYAKEQYPDVQILDNRIAHVDLDERFQTLGTFFDDEIRVKYGKYETEVCKNLERVLPSLYYSSHERLFFFHVWLSYWLQQFAQLKPDVVFFVNSPMLPSHFILYLVCLEEHVTMLVGNNISHPSRLTNFKTRVDSLPIGLAEAFADKKISFEEKGEDVISDWAQEYFEKNQQYKVPDYLAEKQEKVAKSGLKGEYFRLQRQLLISPLFKTIHFLARLNYYCTGRYRMEWLVRERKKGQLANYYHDICYAEPPLGEKYLYLPLHYQPERSTSPDAGIFADQHLIAKTLDRALPVGWKLYVKEHPSQFASYNEGEKGREIADYKELERLKSVRIIREDFPSERLIQKSQAVVTCTGTAGWEAVLRKIPVLLFATIWYQLCSGVFPVRTVAEVKDAIQRIRNGERPDEIEAQLLIDCAREASCSLWVPGTETFNQKDFVSCLIQAYGQQK